MKLLTNGIDIIADGAAYTGVDGTQYPWDFPKDQIPGLQPLEDVPAPDHRLFIVGERRVKMVKGKPVMVWDSTPRPLAEVIREKAAELSTACRNAIIGGFVSGALGAPHTYPMSDKDQTNLLGRVTQAQMDPSGTYNLWCTDKDGNWAKRPHTAAQTIAVGLAAAAWVQSCSDKLSGEDGHGGLLEIVANAGDIAAAMAVEW